MKRWLVAGLLLLAAQAASAKVLCPTGRYALQASERTPAFLAGTELALGAGRAAITGACTAVRAGDFHRPTQAWLYWVRARWNRCAGGRRVRLRAHFDLQTAAYCLRLQGVIRVGGRAVPFVADRVAECGNELREAGEQCDDGPGGGFCCDAACRMRPGCEVPCDAFFPCAADEICVHTCGLGGSCRPRANVDCAVGPVCACDQFTTYANACEAYDAGTGVSAGGACVR